MASRSKNQSLLFRSNVILRMRRQTHTQLTELSTRTTKVVGKKSSQNILVIVNWNNIGRSLLGRSSCQQAISSTAKTHCR